MGDLLAGLKHPHIAEWLDAYDDPDGFVIVHDYMAGVSGGTFPTTQQISPTDARTLARQLCQALQAGEKLDLPHGDLKPNNFVLAAHEREGVFLQVLDWGLHSCRDGADQESLFFMAPEVLRGSRPSSQSDLFSAAASLCYLLTGCVPVQGRTREEMLAAWPQFEVMVLRQMRPDLDDHFLRWLQWLMHMRPEHRPATVSHALEVLWQVIAYANAEKPKASPPAAAPAASPARAPTGPLRPTPQKPAAAAAPKSAPTQPMPAKVAASPPTDQSTAAPAAPSQSWAKGVIVALSAMALLLGVTCAWLRLDWGPGWSQELGRRWEQWSFENLPDFKSSRSSPAVVAAAPAAVETPEPAPSPKPAPAKPAPPPIVAALDPLEYAAGTDLNGADGGKGWASPWKASNVASARSDDGKYVFAAFGGGKTSSAQRDAGQLGKLLVKGAAHLYVTAFCPAADAPELRVDLAGLKEAAGGAPLLFKAENGKIHISIEGSPDVIEAPPNAVARVVVRYDFKKQRNGTYEVEIRAFLNPNPKSRSPLNGCPTSRRVLKGVKPPANLIVSLQAAGGAKRLTVGDLNVAGQLNDVLK